MPSVPYSAQILSGPLLAPMLHDDWGVYAPPVNVPNLILKPSETLPVFFTVNVWVAKAFGSQSPKLKVDVDRDKLRIFGI